MTDTYCVLTDLSLSVHNGGHVSICNGSREIFYSDDGTPITLDKFSLAQAWNSPTRKEIQQSLKNGVQHKNCDDCWIKERAGHPSMRQNHNSNLSAAIPLNDRPRVIVLKPGNVCNLACRHCDPATSTGWYNDAYSLEQKPNGYSYHDFLKKYKIVKESYDPENSNVWGDLSKWIPDLLYYDLYGAEPLLLKPVLKLLDAAVATNSAKNQTIHINTNGTIWRDEFFETFTNFKQVFLDISVDGIQEQFEYMRHPANWQQVLDNIIKYKKLSRIHSNIQVAITVTVSVYNIWYLNDIVKYFNDLEIECGINILHNPENMNIRILPDNVKKLVEEKNTNFSSVTNFMNMDIDDSEQLFANFFYNTHKIDTIRQQDFTKVFPEFYEIIKEYDTNFK